MVKSTDVLVRCPKCHLTFHPRGYTAHRGSSSSQLEWSHRIVQLYDLVPRDPTRLDTPYKIRLPSRRRFPTGWPLCYRWYVPRVLHTAYQNYRAFGASVLDASKFANTDFENSVIYGVQARKAFERLFSCGEEEMPYAVESDAMIRLAFDI